MERIGLFGGTFDPVHKGHLAIARAFLDSPHIDRLWVILTPEPPHKQDRSMADYTLRKSMLEEAFSNMDDAEISDVEQHLPRPSYTVRTVRHLKEEHPDKTFYLCIGGDSLVNFNTWHRYEEILELCNLLVARRPGEDYNRVSPEILDQVHFVDHEPVEISASSLRDKLKNNEDVDDMLPAGVMPIIRKHSPYRS